MRYLPSDMEDILRRLRENERAWRWHMLVSHARQATHREFPGVSVHDEVVVHVSEEDRSEAAAAMLEWVQADEADRVE